MADGRGLRAPARRAVQVCNVNSDDITADDWLRLALTRTNDPALIQQMFDRY